jgi:hypothetical protein
MLLKLLLPTHQWIADGAIVAQWHKTPGEIVNYGDDILDVRIEEGIITRAVLSGWSENEVRALIRAQMSSGDVQDHDLMLEKSEPMEVAKVPVNALLRISSSDRGTLRRIHAREGECHATGACLALFTTEAGEPIEETERASLPASVFRVVVTPLVPFQDDV